MIHRNNLSKMLKKTTTTLFNHRTVFWGRCNGPGAPKLVIFLLSVRYIDATWVVKYKLRIHGLEVHMSSGVQINGPQKTGNASNFENCSRVNSCCVTRYYTKLPSVHDTPVHFQYTLNSVTGSGHVNTRRTP